MGNSAIRQAPADAYGYISYSHDDRKYAERLSRHLLPAVWEELGIDFWMDNSIAAGDRWDENISGVLAQANVFVVCMSANYLASEFIYNIELPTIRKRSRLSHGLIIPVILKPCSWWGFVDDLQVIPTRNGRVVPISDWRPQENGYHEAAVQVVRAVGAISP